MGEKLDTSINERLKSFLDELGDSYSSIADKTGIPRRTLYSLIEEGATIKSNYISALCEKYALDVNWLFWGAENNTPIYKDMTPVSHQVHEPGFTPGEDAILDEDEFYTVPFYPNVKASAGSGLIPREGRPPLQIAFRKYYITQTLRSSARSLVAITIKGDSMYPTLHSGDVILIDQSRCRPVSGNILLIRIDEHVSCKRVQELPDQRLKIMSDNTAYESFQVKLNNPSFDILGQVVWFARGLI